MTEPAHSLPPGAGSTPDDSEGDLPEFRDVDAARARLDDLQRLEVHDHPAVFADVHASLAAALGAVDADAAGG